MANSATVGILRALLTADTAQFKAGMQGAASSARAWQKDLASIGRQASDVGRMMTVGLTAPILGVGVASVKSFMNFEDSFAGVRKTVNASEPEFAALAAGFRQLSREIPINVNELNKIGEAAGQLGIKKENIIGFTAVVAKLGVTTNLTSDTAASALARIANITQMPQENFERLGSTIVALGNNFATTEAEIVEFGLRIAGAGTQAGMSEAQIMAIGTALSSVGVEAEAGGTAVQKVILEMVKATVQGGKELTTFAKTAGMSAGEFKRAFEEDAAGAFTAFVNGLGKQGKNAITVLDDLGLADQRLIRSFLALSGAGDLLNRTMDVGTQAWKDNTALTKEAEERFKTTTNQLKLLWNQISDVAISLGQSLVPVMRTAMGIVRDLVPYLQGAVQWFSGLPEPVQMGAMAMLAVVAAAGPLLWVFGQMATSASTLIGLFTAKGLAMRGIGLAGSFAMPLVTGFWAAVTGPVGLAVAGIALVVGGLRALTGSWDFITVPVGMAWQAMKDVWTLVSQDLAPSFEALSTLVQSLATVIEMKFVVQLREARYQLQLLWEIAKLMPGPIRSALELLGGLNREAELVRAKQGKERLDALRDSLEGAMHSAHGAADGIDRVGGAVKRNTPPTVQLTAEQKKYNEEIAKTAKLYNGQQLAQDVKRLTDVLKASGGAAALSVQAYAKLAGEVAELHEQGATLPDELHKIWLQHEKLNPSIAFTTGNYRELLSVVRSIPLSMKPIPLTLPVSDTVASLNSILNSVGVAQAGITSITGVLQQHGFTTRAELIEMARQATISYQLMREQGESVWTAPEIERARQAMIKANIDAGRLSGAGFVESFRQELTVGIAQALADAIRGIAQGQSLQASLDDLNKSIGQKFGASIGMYFAGPAGAAIGGAIGDIIGAVPIYSLFRRGQNDTKKDRESAAQALGFSSLAALYSNLQSLGAEGAALAHQGLNVIGKKDTAANNAWIKSVQELFAKQKGDSEAAAAAAAKAEADAAAAAADAFENAQGRIGAALAGVIPEVIDSQEEFDRLARIALNTFNALVSSGLSPVEAMQQIGGSVDVLMSNMQKLGLEGSAAYDALARWRELTEVNAPLLGQIGSLTELMQLTTTLGGMTAEAFADMAAQGTAAYDKLIAGGFTELEALTAMKPFLEQIIALQKEKGFEIDAGTQKLINQANKHNILAGEQMSTNDILMEGLSAVIQALGGTVPDAFRTMASKAKDVAKEIENHMREAARGIAGGFESLHFTVPVSFAVAGGGLSLEGGSSGAVPRLPGFAKGTNGQYVDFGAGTLAMLHGREMITPEGQGGGRGAPIPITLHHTTTLDGRVVAENQVQYLAFAYKDAGF